MEDVVRGVEVSVDGVGEREEMRRGRKEARTRDDT